MSLNSTAHRVHHTLVMRFGVTILSHVPVDNEQHSPDVIIAFLPNSIQNRQNMFQYDTLHHLSIYRFPLRWRSAAGWLAGSLSIPTS